MLYAVFLLLAMDACVASKGPDTETADSDSSSDDTDAQETGDTGWIPPGKAAIVVTVDINIAGIFALNTSGDGQPMGDTTSSGSLVIGYVDPGDWWSVAYGDGMTACNRSDVTHLEPGEALRWTVDALPGKFDTSTNECVVP